MLRVATGAGIAAPLVAGIAHADRLLAAAIRIDRDSCSRTSGWPWPAVIAGGSSGRSADDRASVTRGERQHAEVVRTCSSGDLRHAPTCGASTCSSSPATC